MRFERADRRRGHDEVRRHARVGRRERRADEPARDGADAPHGVEAVDDRAARLRVDADRHHVHRHVLDTVGDACEHLGRDEPTDRGRHGAHGQECRNRESSDDRRAARAEPRDQWWRGSRPGDAAERERDERDAESAHGGTELGGQCGCRREPHGRGDAVHEERGGDATHGRDVDLGEGALGGDGEKGRRRAASMAVVAAIERLEVPP